jgi:D-alanyl-D-alanine carboxypeptidase (penicillin-binding protein 5/6)
LKHKKAISIITIIINAVVCILARPEMVNAQVSDSSLYARSAVLMDADSGRILFEKDGYTARPNASTTKILTCILALEYGNLEDVVYVSSYAAKMPDVQLNICEGEEYYLGDLMYSLMLESHNDTAVAIAEHISGSVEEFAKLMNQKAADIGCQNSYFITPNGLDAEDDTGIHSVSAADLALIMRYCITLSPKKDEFLKITATASYSFSDLGGNRYFTCNNHNSFLSMMDGALTGKTGFTGNAGYCYVGALERNGHTYIVALLACGWPNNKTYKWLDTELLMKHGIDDYNDVHIYSGDLELPKLKVENGVAKEYVELEVYYDFELRLGAEDEISYDIMLPDILYAPVLKQSVVGTVYIYVNDELYDMYPVYTAEEVELRDFSYEIKSVIDRFLVSNTK